MRTRELLAVLADYDTQIPMPKLEPIRIPTKGLSWWRRFLVHFKRRNWRLTEDYELYIPWLGITLMAPKGFIVDGASVPRIVWPIINPTGILLIGSIFHDFGYKYDSLLDKDWNVCYSGEGKAFMDELFKDINIYVNDVHSMNTVAWAALAAFGFFAWNGHRKRDIKVTDDYPQAILNENG